MHSIERVTKSSVLAKFDLPLWKRYTHRARHNRPSRLKKFLVEFAIAYSLRKGDLVG